MRKYSIDTAGNAFLITIVFILGVVFGIVLIIAFSMLSGGVIFTQVPGG